MIATRREVLLGLAALSACGPKTATRGDVFAAGQPAAILIMALAPSRLLGWPRRPADAAFQMLPAAADLPERGALASGGAPASFERVASLKPTMILDYGDVHVRYRQLAERIRARIGTEYFLIDGALVRTSDALRRAGVLLGAEPRATRLADYAQDVIARWSAPARAAPSFYYARGRDGLETGFAGALATEVLEGAGWRNVALGGRDIGRVTRERVVAWEPEVLVTLDANFARGAAADPTWRRRSGGGDRRILLLPELPFGWIDRPPSINRLLGCAWFGSGPMPEVDASTADMATNFAQLFYGVTPSAAQTRLLLPRWLT